ncbi:ABC transporter ATP-binding protein [Cohaesibacter celericrescens]|uniref:ABC transporter ATP-binding protein n=1 Tax=Cohaesibacter celericrescens TaxID=2067669 RepID=A0A2N5XT06_9HYPH|nr:ABC transporter ATP-binding protein [Cohaesibacter celericrescens]PLW77587.1 ABC transporter ATP-binding protein [Cohaesibacter celericrescens]
MGERDKNIGWGHRGTAGASIAAGLAFDAVACSFSGKEVLRDITLSVEPGEVVSLLGQSGSGKTTMLRIAAGIERLSSGRVLINNKEVSSDTVFVPPEQRSVGLMFQDYALFPHLSILKNVMFGLNDLPAKASEIEARAALRRVGLEGYAEHFPHMLSGGQQQRVALARAIAPRPSILLMDEPFSGLDNRLRDRVRDETLAVLREIGATCIIVTHDPEEALRMSDRIVLLRNGKIVQYAKPEDLYYHPVDHWAARFFSDLNEIEGVYRGGKARTAIGDFTVDGFDEGQELLICIRQQGVKLHIAIDEGYAPGLPARVKRRMFLGEVDLYEISVKGIDKPFFVRSRAGQYFASGENIGVSFRKKDVLIFAKQE